MQTKETLGSLVNEDKSPEALNHKSLYQGLELAYFDQPVCFKENYKIQCSWV